MIRRVLFAMMTLWLVVTVVFFLLRMLPGDALSAQLEMGGASRADIAQARAHMGLDDPIGTQYLRYMAGLLRGDMGISLMRLLPVSEIISQRLAPTAILAILTMTLAILWGIGTGILATLHGVWGVIGRGTVVLALGTPIYWTGTLAIIAFASILPYSGVEDWRAWLLPIMVLAFHSMGGIARVTQANILTVRHLPFVMVAQSKGLPRHMVMRRHVLRVALLPVLPVITTQFGFLLGGTVILEALFVRMGLGRLLLDSVVNQDYPTVQGIVVLSALVYVLLSILNDALMMLLDPRLRMEK